MQKSYTAINASAGSGKTYTLVQRVLMICLKQQNNHDAIQHILALTFTNKAANEMKQRILEWLKDFTKPNYADNQNLKSIKVELEKQNVRISMQDLHERSQKVLDYILHHYSTLNIGTIDKFNARLVRSFSYELGLAHQFNLEIQSEPFLIEAVDKMLDEIGEDEKISDAFMDFINYNLDNDERTNLNNTLYRKAKQFVSDVHYEELKNNENFGWDSYERLKTQLREEISNHKNEGKKIAESSLSLIKEKGLTEEDFQGKSNSIAAFFRKYLEFTKDSSKDFPFPSNEENTLANYRKGTASKDAFIQSSVGEIVDFLIESRAEIIRHYIQSQKKEKILKELLPLKINREIQEQLEIIEEENDLVLLSKFNVLINENLKNEPSNFIYEKIGTRYNHFFFDEFQDTSKMQWENILPLKEHTVHSENSSFTLVGDPKQSIYRFRGGESELMLNILNHNEKSFIKADVEVLESNWRSAKHIVEFNNELYQFISKDLQQEHQELFSDKAKQIPQKKFLGRVKVNLNDYDRKTEPFFENSSEQMHRDIQECVDNGFDFSDITILCRTGKEIQKYVQYLGSKKISYKGKETYIKTISERGLTLDLSNTLNAVVEYLRWENQPKNLQFPVKMLYFLNELGRIYIEDFTEAMLEMLEDKSPEKIIAFIHEKFGVKLRRGDIPQLNIYNNIEYLVREFSVAGKETDFSLNFLEMLYNFTQKSGVTTKDFLNYWDEEGHKISIQASENIDAINMMTIHAAKGLEFPVVFLPMRNSAKDGEFNEWLPLQEFGELKSVNVKAFNSSLAVYDEEIAKFNTENSYKNTIDRFCTQYVATTRPVEQLFLYLQRPSKTGKPMEILEFIESKSGISEDEFDLYPEVENSFRKQNFEEAKIQQTLDIQNLAENPENISNIKIATPSKNYQNTVPSVRTGIFTHEILSKINTEKDVEKVLETYVLEGTLNLAEKEEIETKIRDIITNENFTKYFAEGLKIINENDIMLSENDEISIYRPDRLVKTTEGFYIIDFKTGAEKEKHEAQVKTYQNVLEKLGKTVIGTEIIYI